MLYGVLGFFALLIIVSTWRRPRLTSILFWSLSATLFFTAAMLLVFPANFPDKAITITLMVPFIWVALQFWVYWAEKPQRVTAGLIALTLASAAIVFTNEPMV